MRIMNKVTLEKVMEYNIEYQKQFGISPSYRDIMHQLKLGSLATVQRYLRVLESEGRLQRTNLGSIKILPQLDSGKMTLTPLLGEVACGQPNTAVEYIEGSFSLPQTLFGEGELFMLHAYGNSMVDIGIDGGDLVVIRKQNCANDGEIVVALVGCDATLKRIYRREGKIVLHPENKEMQDIIVNDCEIQGVLVSCIKMYNFS